MKYASVWLLGTLPNILPEPSSALAQVLHKWGMGLIGMITVVILLISRKRLDDFSAEFLAACLFTVMIYITVNTFTFKHTGIFKLSALIKHLSNFSYTLYLVHFPVINFLAIALAPQLGLKWQPTPDKLLFHLGISVVILIYAYGVGMLTEAHTASVRSFFYQRLAVKR